MTKSILVSAFILLCAVIIESSILSNISFIYIVPDLVLICSIYFSLLNGKVVGETTGFISGLLLDFVTGIPFGFNCLFRTIIGYVYGIFAKNVIISGFILPMLCVGIGTISKITTLDYNSSLNIELVPIIDFARLENVVVVNQKELNDRKAYKE